MRKMRSITESILIAVQIVSFSWFSGFEERQNLVPNDVPTPAKAAN